MQVQYCEKQHAADRVVYLVFVAGRRKRPLHVRRRQLSAANG
jgi:hypothetical protein